MRDWIGAGLVVGLAVLVAAPLSAQQRPAAPAYQQDPGLNAEDQLSPSQITQPMPGAVSEPSPSSGAKRPPPRHATAEPMPEPAAGVKPARPGPVSRTVVACSGPFARDSGMLALAMAFDSRNVTYTEVDVSGAKVGESIVYPKDPRRRLEVWWANPNRTGTYLILINGQSMWSAPEGLRLGLTLEQLEKLNHKPFKLKGFDKDGVATIDDWDGGALAALPGGCKASASLRPDPKAAADEVSALAADHEYTSTDPAMRAVRPKVSEILLGY
jgi:hypothetical protein